MSYHLTSTAVLESFCGFAYNIPMTILLIAAVIPPLYLIYRVYQLDRIEKEPPRLLFKLFLLGIAALAPTFVLETIGENILAGDLFSQIDPTIRNLIKYFIVVAWVEEGCKHFVLKRGSWNHPAFDFSFDAVVYSVVVSLGFAAVENIGYVFPYGLETAVMRALTSIPGHCIFGIFMGHYYGMAKVAEQRKDLPASRRFQRKSLILPIILHGFYDFTASSDHVILVAIFFAYIIILDIVAIRSVRKYSREDHPIGGIRL